ncbi:MAG: aspartate carbamoyltransferase [Candidatus Bathyarchaeota archaeon]|jgi:aspartate carbamoyltransferase catalytic subunit|nr:aspartate carbamoyltransferase [Candidatus Bathyarchaeota archaeon]
MVSAKIFKDRDIISMREFNRAEIDFILDTADDMVKLEQSGSNLLKGKVMAALFFEPSTRTRLSFESAMNRLGGSVIGFATPAGSSVEKGESLADTIRTVSRYSDTIVMRHPDEMSSRMAARVATVPVINGGSGSWEHPTQALLDLHTIRSDKGTIDGLNIALAGDLKFGRTTHSLAVALRNYDVKCTFVSPKALRMRQDVIDDVDGKLTYTVTEDLKSVLPEMDIVYATRIQKERFSNPADYARLKDAYLINKEFLKGAKKEMKLMHPLPRINEISTDVDNTPHALYFKQMRHGVYLRMAILALVLGTV